MRSPHSGRSPDGSWTTTKTIPILGSKCAPQGSSCELNHNSPVSGSTGATPAYRPVAGVAGSEIIVRGGRRATDTEGQCEDRGTGINQRLRSHKPLSAKIIAEPIPRHKIFPHYNCQARRSMEHMKDGCRRLPSRCPLHPYWSGPAMRLRAEVV